MLILSAHRVRGGYQMPVFCSDDESVDLNSEASTVHSTALEARKPKPENAARQMQKTEDAINTSSALLVLKLVQMSAWTLFHEWLMDSSLCRTRGVGVLKTQQRKCTAGHLAILCTPFTPNFALVVAKINMEPTLSSAVFLRTVTKQGIVPVHRSSVTQQQQQQHRNRGRQQKHQQQKHTQHQQQQPPWYVPDEQGRSVNELLADLRRSAVSSPGQQEQQQRALAALTQPSLPPVIRDILQLPETPAPRPRRPTRFDAFTGRRLPPGPAPPQSWLAGPSGSSLSSSRHAPSSPGIAQQHRNVRSHGHALPGAYLPAPKSLIDMVLRKMALDWEFQRSYQRYYLFGLPTHLKIALVIYLGVLAPEGVSVEDLRALLLPPVVDEEDMGDNDPEAMSGAMFNDDPSVMNEDFRHLDLSGALSRSLKLRQLSDLLFPYRQKQKEDKGKGVASASLQESWDAPEQPPVSPSISPMAPRPLLPNLTHLSLAIDPESASASEGVVTWRYLLNFAARLPALTHLSLAFWPEPTLTPNAKYVSFIDVLGRTIRYGGNGPHSHSLENDWSEAVMVLSRLSRSLYGLEYLDLTGCQAWSPALWSSVEHDAVDWVGDWGKVHTVLLYPGYYQYQQPSADDLSKTATEKAKYAEAIDNAVQLEKHIRTKRAGQGRFITVESAKRAPRKYYRVPALPETVLIRKCVLLSKNVEVCENGFAYSWRFRFIAFENVFMA
ncbi:hypothetical protein QBC46DRAFT_436739 [Diplogelasinospora grovesii]|uniref:Uncharacterized protein n=1 Tax=Diplogelasinospora grovesii TaxID=303347 RepID=A0AAN6N8N4_9PEZI|nr:hypothetical protein QBC46DRAFT_436739 [Diplogelasinospora grovesii]